MENKDLFSLNFSKTRLVCFICCLYVILGIHPYSTYWRDWARAISHYSSHLLQNVFFFSLFFLGRCFKMIIFNGEGRERGFIKLCNDHVINFTRKRQPLTGHSLCACREIQRHIPRTWFSWLSIQTILGHTSSSFEPGAAPEDPKILSFSKSGDGELQSAGDEHYVFHKN